jgi:hypothetical protein
LDLSQTMKINFSCLVACYLFLAVVPVQAGDLLNEEERWKFVVESNNIGYVQDFLLKHPGSVHTAEARKMLALHPGLPLGRLTSDTPVCRDALSMRSASLLSGYVKNEKYPMYDFSIPENHFINSPILEIVPKTDMPDQVEIEKKFILELTATNAGRCIINLRWNYGSGLPAECRCDPVDKNYEFESSLANGILIDYSRMQANNDVCKSHERDFSAEIENYLADAIKLKKARADSLRALKDAGKFVLPTELGEMEDIYFALPKLEKKKIQTAEYEKTKLALAARGADELGYYCKRQFPEDISQARQRLQDASMRVR